MRLSEKAQALKQQMIRVVNERQECELLEAECREWLDWRASDCEYAEEGMAEELLRARMAARRRFAAAQVHNAARLQGDIGLTPIQRRLMRLRYVQGWTWGRVITELGKTKQYVLREHNKALEKMVDETERLPCTDDAES